MNFLNDTAILCSGGSLKHLNLLLDKKIKYVILINYFWNDPKNKYKGSDKEPLWKNKFVYDFLKNKEIILWTREITGDIKSLFKNLNVIKCFYSRWSTTILDDYDWLNKYKGSYLIKKLRLTGEKYFTFGNRNFEIIPNKLLEYCKDDLIFFVENIAIFKKKGYSDSKYFKMWLSTTGHALDYALIYLNAKKIYLIGWDCYEGGSVNNQLNVPIIFRGCDVRKEWVNGSKSCFLKKVKDNPKISFELITYMNFETKTPSQYEDNEYHNLDELTNLKIVPLPKPVS